MTTVAGGAVVGVEFCDGGGVNVGGGCEANVGPGRTGKTWVVVTVAVVVTLPTDGGGASVGDDGVVCAVGALGTGASMDVGASGGFTTTLGDCVIGADDGVTLFVRSAGAIFVVRSIMCAALRPSAAATIAATTAAPMRRRRRRRDGSPGPPDSVAAGAS